MKKWLLGVGVGLCSMVAYAAEVLPVEIRPDDPKLYYVGRFDQRDAAGPRFTWSNSMVTVRFHGTDLQARFREEGDNYYEVVTDQKAHAVVHPEKGVSVIDLAKGLPDGEHVVQFVRRTEGHAGIGQFMGFNLNRGGELLAPEKLAHRIEVIGDSITCGYGNESANENVHFVLKDENAYMAYGAIAAREVGAEYVAVAFSGRKMWPDNTMPELYGRSLTFDPGSTWDFSKWTAEAVVINLATNDFGPGIPDEKGWTEAYGTFVRQIRANYPNAMIYLASGSMMSDNWPPEKKVLSVLKGYLSHIQQDLQAAGDTKVRTLHFDPQDGGVDGMGGDWHPSIKTHQKMAAKLAKALEADLGWKAVGTR